MDDAYERLIRRMNPPRVVIDNNSCESATVIQVDSVNKRGILLDVVQILADLNLIISKAYISSDGGWFMDVFNVTDQDGEKLRDEKIVDIIQKSLDTDASFRPPLTQTVGVMASHKHTSIELVGADRPGLLSEVCAVLTNLKCNVVEAEVWTHNARAAAVVLVTDASTGTAIEDQKRLSLIKELLCNVLKGNNELRAAKTTVVFGATHRQRRLHQMMYEDRDYERTKSAGAEPESTEEGATLRPQVTLGECLEKDYSVVTLRSRDRPKLLFDTVCTLTDMQYVVFHGTVDTSRMEAYQEYYIRHVDGFPISSEAERKRVIRCLEAAVERRVSEGLKLELSADDRVGLLSDVTRIFRENSLCITRAEITTKDCKALDIFHVRDVSGNPVDSKTIESIRHHLGQTVLRVKHSAVVPPATPTQETITEYLFGSLFKARPLQSLRLVRSCS